MIKLNKLPLMAFVLGLGFIVGMSSFKTSPEKVAEGEWGLHNGIYYDINNLPPDLTYQCTGSSGVCTKIYEGNPNETGTFVRNSTKTGVFELVPE